MRRLKRQTTKSLSETAFQLFWTAIIVSVLTAVWAFVWQPHGAWFFVAVGFCVCSLLFALVTGYLAFADHEPAPSLSELMRHEAKTLEERPHTPLPVADTRTAPELHRREQNSLTGKVAAAQTKPEPNIILLREDDPFVELDEHDVFREVFWDSRRPMRALVAEFSNEEDPPRQIGELRHVGARIFYYTPASMGEPAFRVNHGHWLEEEWQTVSFGEGEVRKLLLGTIDFNRLTLTVYDNRHESVNKYLSPSGLDFVNTKGIVFDIKVRLVGGERRDWGKEFRFKFKLENETSFEFSPVREGTEQAEMQGRDDGLD
jgi:hypothetical protein